MKKAQDHLAKAEDLSANLPPLLLQALKSAQGMMRGAHGRRKSGFGEAFWQFRPWQAGDASRAIDWRQSAKRENLFVREKELETAQTALLWRDASASMRFSGARNRASKKDYADTLLLSLALLMLDAGERVGILGSALPPQTGVQAVTRICAALEDAPDFPAIAGTGRAHIALFSDFYFPLEETADFCAGLAASGAEGVIVQVTDPAEEKLPGHGRVKFQDMEDAQTLDVESVEALRGDYARLFSAHQQGLREIAQRLGWAYEAVSTGETPEKSLMRLYHLFSSQRVAA